MINIMPNIFERMPIDEFSSYCNKDVIVKYTEETNELNTKEIIGRIVETTVYQSKGLCGNISNKKHLIFSFSLIDKKNEEHKLLIRNIISIKNANDLI